MSATSLSREDVDICLFRTERGDRRDAYPLKTTCGAPEKSLWVIRASTLKTI
jgi:hypothetical protein